MDPLVKPEDDAVGFQRMTQWGSEDEAVGFFMLLIQFAP
jgi:hypothetical protein